MITDSFDISTEPIISPASFSPQKYVCDTCLVIFSRELHAYLLENYDCQQECVMESCASLIPIYTFTYQGKKLAFYLTHIGATAAATYVIEANWLMGASKFVMFGSAGSLNREATAGKYVIPTEAYRDEGMSYHYAPPADYISVQNAPAVADILASLRVPYVCGRVWSTDAFYRETRALVQKRRDEGCLAVEMEVAGVQAVCDFHGFALYNFLQTGDVLDAPQYDHSGLHSANHTLDKLFIALEIALRV